MTKESKEFNFVVGQRMRAARRSAGMPMHALGDAIGISYQSVFKAEQGNMGLSLWRAVCAADALGISIDDLIGGAK